jgi:hypothetical protein
VRAVGYYSGSELAIDRFVPEQMSMKLEEIGLCFGDILTFRSSGERRAIELRPDGNRARSATRAA